MSFSPLFDQPLFNQAPETGGGALVTTEPAAPAVDIFTKATVLQLQFRRLGTEQKVSTAAISVNNETEDSRTDPALVKVTRTILDSPELKAIEKHDGLTGRFIDAKKCGPAFANQGGFHLVPLTIKPTIDQWIAERLAERAGLVELFLAVLPDRFNETRAKLGPLGKDLVAPRIADVREKFGVTVRYMSFGYTDEAAPESWRREAMTECRAALRGVFRDLIGHMAERLTPGAEGKPKTFRDSLIEKFEAFTASFNDRNLADDAELQQLVDQAREMMRGVSPKDLREQEGLRAAVAARVAEMKTTIDAMVQDKPTRAYMEAEE